MTEGTNMAEKGINLHKEHRKRMFSRYNQTRFNGFEDHEVLEMLLFFVIRLRNTNDIAHALLNRFKSIGKVLAAPFEELMKVENVGRKTARYLNIWGDTFNRSDFSKPMIAFYGQTSRDFLINLFKDKKDKCVYMMCLDTKYNLLDCSLILQGDFENIESVIEKILKIALDYDCAQVVFAHNQTGGDVKPSRTDVDVTNSIARKLLLVEVYLRDHIIVSGDKLVSMRKTCKEIIPSGRFSLNYGEIAAELINR